MKVTLLFICCLSTVTIQAQQTTGKKTMTIPSNKNSNTGITYNTLFQYGVADSFIGGLFEATLPVSELKQHGDFGIGAPGQVDGELIVYKGHAYQTQAKGITREVPDTFKTALGFVTFFKADTAFHISAASNQKEAFDQIEKYLHQKNGVYAIKISGSFDHLKTRAFPPYTQKPYPSLATLIGRQKFFEFSNTKGTIVGYKLPHYLNGLSIEGFHFHFLSDSKTQGGHVLDFSGADLTVEVAKIQNFLLSIPQDSDFMNYNFIKKDNPDLEKVEKGH
ncbi:acetolactate decarboxylase [Pedobacter hartonius]|nr:acetolactate decarboxylase [Pedobacter hartonius]